MAYYKKDFSGNMDFMIRESFKKGLGFGLTSGIITTVGLMVGLYSGTHSKAIVIGGILTIAVADSLSDSLGIHVSEEFEKESTTREVWEATVSTFFFKLVFSSILIIPVLLFELLTAIVASIIFGFLMIGLFSFKFAKERGLNPWKSVAEHLIVAVVVIIATYYVGYWISSVFN